MIIFHFLRPAILFVFLTLFLLFSCNRQVPVNDITNLPTFHPSDETFKDVYRPLDGKWKGQFKIYQDTLLAKRSPDLLKDLSPASLEQEHLYLSMTIEVEQEYISENPYFQRVTITDHYPESGQTVVSKGVNKVQDGKMWCVVHKPDETVIHEGGTDGPSTIIWQRQESDPQRIEYFRETVETNTYEIIGWGYYDDADPEKMPPYWFYGKYERSEGS